MTGGWLRGALAAATAFIAGCGALPSPRSCSSPSDCPTLSLCEGGVCVADQPPVAVFEPPSSPVSNLPLVFDGGGSFDPDPGDSISAWQWMLSSEDGACDPEPGSGSGQKLSVVFPCAGNFRVSLVVADSVGLSSAPAAQLVAVAQSSDPPQVTVGSDVTVDHQCSGTPLLCTPWDGTNSTVALSALASGPAGLTYSYAWSAVLPQALSSTTAPQIAFLPGPEAASPSVLISTRGTAIAGTYAFSVEVTDSRGMVAVGRTNVTVGNRPPVVSGGGTFSIPHSYQAATKSFVAAGTTPPLTVSDPDGDPVTSLGFAFSHSGDGGSAFVGVGQGTAAAVTVTVPYASPGDAALLIGPAVVRRADLSVVDANGASATGGFAVVVTNQAPRLTSAVPSASVNHAFDPVGQDYFAVAPLSTWVDDDGDPLQASVTGDPLCPTAAASQGTAWVTCSVPYAGVPAVGALAGAHSLTVTMSDPFTAGPAEPTTLTILDRPPVIATSPLSLPAACTSTGACCQEQAGTCRVTDVTWGASQALSTVATDPDGDPLALSLSTSGACLSASAPAGACPFSGCSAELSLCSLPSQCLTAVPSGALSVTASDGLDFAQGTIEVGAVCQ